GCWDLVGGKAEAGESAKEAIVREVKEETGIKIENPKLFWVTDFDDRVEHTFWQKTNLKISEIALQEGQRLEWFSEGRIRKTPEEKIGFGFKPVILNFFEKKLWLS
ncbi:MAG: NUDIX domain-containing protein, partial [bacterium]